MTKLCLNMIVKNEAKNLVRLFETVISIIDCWIISDTGSTDNTIEVIETYFKQKGIPGRVYHHTWKNFGHNRTLALEAAQQCEFEFDYILLLDADMKLVISPHFNKQTLNCCDVHNIKQGSPSLTYYNVRILRRSLSVKCVGPTHEYYDITGSYTKGNMDDLFIDDIGDGGSKDDKFPRDIRLLLQGIAEEPDNMRYYFYLARSYECVNDVENAIKYYNERIKRGGWDQEVWYSYYSIGNLYKRQNDTEKAVHNYLLAYDANQRRIENIYKIIEIYRCLGKQKVALHFVQMAEEIIKSGQVNEHEILFMEPEIYKYMLGYEKSILLYYVQDHVNGRRISNILMLNPRVKPHIVDNVARNYKFYAQNIGNLNGKLELKLTMTDDVRKQLGMEAYPDYRHISNPSIAKLGEDTYINLRCINYKAENKGINLSYSVYKDDKNVCVCNEHPVHTMNILCKLDKEQNIEQCYNLDIESELKPQYTNFAVKGVEDVRIFEHNKMLYFVGTCRELIPTQINRMVLGRFNFTTKRVENVVMLHNYEDNACNKNWSPFIYKDKLLILFSFGPLVILEPDLDTGKCTVYKNKPQQFNYNNFRGGSQGFWIDGNLYFIVHFAVCEDGRTYYHRIVQLDNDLDIINVSQPFYIEELGIEFVAGGYYDATSKSIKLSWGKKDMHGCISSLPFDHQKIFN